MSAHRGVIWWSIWPAMVLKMLSNLSQNEKSIRSMWWWERYFRTALWASRACMLSCYVRCIAKCVLVDWEDSPEMEYFWKAPTEGQERNSSAQSCTWTFGSDILRQGVFVISNETLGSYVVKFHDSNILTYLHHP